MYNRTHITKVTGAAPTQILYNVQHQMSVGATLAKNFTGAVEENGRKIVKAGYPLMGDLADRTTAFTAADTDAVGILLHDVDVTDAAANATVLIWGFVNMDRIDDTTKTKLTTAIQGKLAGKIWFLSDN